MQCFAAADHPPSLSPQVMCINDGGPAYQQAYVSWYGSTTSSLMPCSQLLPFLDTFEVRALEG